MGALKQVKIAKKGEVTIEVIVGFQKPAGIEVALYGKDRRKEKVLGSGVSLDPIPDKFQVAPSAQAASLDGKFVGNFVAISSFSPGPNEPMSVTTILRQNDVPVPGGTTTVMGNVVNGGGGVVIVYQVAVV